MTEQPNSVASSPKFLYYADVTADLDLVALGGGCCRAIRCQVAGTVVVVSEEGDTVTLPFNACETQQVRCRKIVDAGTGSNLGLTILW